MMDLLVLNEIPEDYSHDEENLSDTVFFCEILQLCQHM